MTTTTTTTAPASPRRLGAYLDDAARFARIFSLTVGGIREMRRRQAKFGTPLPREQCHPVMLDWAGKILETLRVRVTRAGVPPSREPVIFVGNHVSYIDIPLLMSVVPVVFIAKKQIAGWPVFGAACRAVGTIFVDRDSNSSRRDAAQSVRPSLLGLRQSIVIFPSGTTTMDESKAWRQGAFRLAKECGVPIQPFRIRYAPMRRAAYLLEDTFLPHLVKLVGSEGVEATLEFGAPVTVDDTVADAERLWRWSREGL